MDEDQKPQQPLYAQPYKDEDDIVPAGPRMADLLEEPPAPPEPAQFQRPISAVKPDAGDGPIRTFQHDIARAIKDKNTSVVQIALAEAKKKEREQGIIAENSVSSRKNVILITLSAILFVAALGAIGYVLWPNSAPQQVTPVSERPIIIVDSFKPLPIDGLDRNALIEALQKEVSGNRERLGTVSRVIPTVNGTNGATPVEAQDFIAKLAPGIPDQLLRSLQPLFYFGIHVFQKNEPYLILKVDSYQSGFAGALAWENRMPYDLADVFVPAANRASTINSRVGFRDEVVSNHDVRALVDSVTRQTVLLYSFVDQGTMVITTNERTLQEISDRISKAGLAR